MNSLLGLFCYLFLSCNVIPGNVTQHDSSEIYRNILFFPTLIACSQQPQAQGREMKNSTLPTHNYRQTAASHCWTSVVLLHHRCIHDLRTAPPQLLFLRGKYSCYENIVTLKFRKLVHPQTVLKASVRVRVTWDTFSLCSIRNTEDTKHILGHPFCSSQLKSMLPPALCWMGTLSACPCWKVILQYVLLIQKFPLFLHSLELLTFCTGFNRNSI